MVSPTDHTFECSSEQKITPKNIVNRYHLLNTLTTTENFQTTMIDEESTADIWTSSDDRTSKSPPITDFYSDSYSSSSSISSYDSNHINQPELNTISSSSGYDSSLTSIPDHLFPTSSNTIIIPNSQFIHLHLDDRHSSPPSSISSLSSQEPTSPAYCRKYLQNNQYSSDTDDDSQSTTISTNRLSPQERPRSLPIAIQQPKTVFNEDEIVNNSSFYPCKDGFKLHSNEPINQKDSLKNFIMSPTDRLKIQMPYQNNDSNKNELTISQPEDIDFKRSKQRAIRVLYQDRILLKSIQSPMGTKSTTLPSPLAKRIGNQSLLRSVVSCSVFEADDEHEVVSSTTRTGVNGKHEKSSIEIFNCLRINFIESLLHGKILPCGVLDGFTVKLGANGLFVPKQVILPVTTFWFNISEHQAASPYLGFINLQSLPKRGYHTPIKGTITLALLNPNGTATHLFFIPYDFSDMPIDHRTFVRQRVILLPENTGDKKENLRYLVHIRFVTTQTGKLFMHSDIRLIFARNKLDYDERTGDGQPQLTPLTEMPTPKYWPRK